MGYRKPECCQDIGAPNAEDHRVEARLACKIDAVMKRKCLQNGARRVPPVSVEPHRASGPAACVQIRVRNPNVRRSTRP
jgi:hypothetical protein